MERSLKRLRDLPGVAQIEARCAIPSYFDNRNISDTMDEIDRVSISLFSLSDVDTDYDDWDWESDEHPPSRGDWEALLSNAMKPFSETQPLWEALGWDITDGEGRELGCAHYFAKQILLVESGWLDGVQFTPDGSGRELAYADQQPTEGDISERLEREVEAFLLRRNGVGRA